MVFRGSFGTQLKDHYKAIECLSLRLTSWNMKISASAEGQIESLTSMVQYDLSELDDQSSKIDTRGTLGGDILSDHSLPPPFSSVVFTSFNYTGYILILIDSRHEAACSQLIHRIGSKQKPICLLRCSTRLRNKGHCGSSHDIWFLDDMAVDHRPRFPDTTRERRAKARALKDKSTGKAFLPRDFNMYDASEHQTVDHNVSYTSPRSNVPITVRNNICPAGCGLHLLSPRSPAPGPRVHCGPNYDKAGFRKDQEM